MFTSLQKSRSVRRACNVTPIILGLSLLAMPMHAQSVDALTSSVQRVQFLEDNGASQRIDFSGKLRMLSQRVVAAGCNYAAGIDPDNSGAVLEATKTEFNMIVDALEFGDTDLGIIGEEERRKTLVGLSKLRELWEPTAVSADLIASSAVTQQNVATFADQSAPLLEMAKLLVSEISAQYSDPTALLQADALIIDIAGRQRMLAQRMSKNVCLIASGVNVEVANAELAGTAQIFDTSLFALRNGMADAGIKPPPTEDIAAGLDVVIADWTALQPIIDMVLAGQALDPEQRSIMFNGSNVMTGNMNKVVGMYSEASKLDL